MRFNSTLILSAGFLSFCLSSNLVLAQGSGMNRDVVLRNHGTTMFYKEVPDDVIGSPYLYDVWFSGELSLRSDTNTYEAAFIYNAFTDIMLFTDGKDTMSIAKPLQVDMISFANMDFIYALSIERIGGQDFIRGGYYQLLAGDSLRLLMKNRKSVGDNRSVNNYMGGGGDGRRRYIQSKTLYIQFEGEDVVKLKKKKSWLINQMADHREEIEFFIDEENINIQNTIDLVSLFNYYNTLTSM